MISYCWKIVLWKELDVKKRSRLSWLSCCSDVTCVKVVKMYNITSDDHVTCYNRILTLCIIYVIIMFQYTRYICYNIYYITCWSCWSSPFLWDPCHVSHVATPATHPAIAGRFPRPSLLVAIHVIVVVIPGMASGDQDLQRIHDFPIKP